MTDLISRPTGAGQEQFLSERSNNSSAADLWPSVERRRGPRRRAEAAELDSDRRSAYIPSQPVVRAEARGAQPRDRHIRDYRRTVVAIDAVAGLVGALLAQFMRAESPIGNGIGALVCAFGLPLLWMAAIFANRAYEPRFLASSAEEYRRLVNTGVGLVAAVSSIAFLFKIAGARDYVIVAIPTCLILSLIGRYVSRRQLRNSRRHGQHLQDVLIVGHEWAVLDLVQELRRHPESGLHVVGACLPGGHGSRRMAQANVPVVGDLSNVAQVVELVHADVLAVTTCVEFGGPELRKVCWALESGDVEVLVAPTLMEVAGPRLHIRPVANLPLLHVEKPEFTGARRILKGIFDRLLASAALLVLAPVLITIAVMVRVTSPGAALFRQTRIGVGGREFTIYKFRSMYRDAAIRLEDLKRLNERSEGLLFKIRKDPRVTSIGRFLRRYSLDELPQLINVVKGDMSLVGPRPPLPEEVERYGDDVRRRLLVRPGVTGLWQVSGRSDLEWDEAVRLDLRYVENWSLVYDFEIMWKTIYAVFRGAGAY